MKYRDSTQIALNILLMLGSARALPTYARGGLYQQINTCHSTFAKALALLEDKGLAKRIANSSGISMMELTAKGQQTLNNTSTNLILLFT